MLINKIKTYFLKLPKLALYSPECIYCKTGEREREKSKHAFETAKLKNRDRKGEEQMIEKVERETKQKMTEVMANII